ncbi:MAG: Na/Pi cotransporter family protein [Deltaproteobacteria bacterium]|nr:Na/Pi cotransporter family protein [Deltaproteobacteria bacterium]
MGLSFVNFIGGLCLFVYGMQVVSSNLQKFAGGRLQAVVSRLTKRRIYGVATGFLMTIAMQGSTATSVMLVSLAGAGLITLQQVMAVILGAMVGSTVTVQIIAFRIHEYSLLLVVVGFLFQWLIKKRLKPVALAVLGFGFVFYGIQLMTQSATHVGELPLFRSILDFITAYPIWSLLLSAAFTGLIHSSAATIGLAISLGMSGVLNIDEALPIVLGANLGTGSTAILASLGTAVQGRQVAWAHFLVKALGVALFFPFMNYFAHFCSLTSGEVARQIANFHTLFNLALGIFFYPLISLGAKSIVRLFPIREEGAAFKPLYLDEKTLESPPFAYGQARREILRMSDIVYEMLRDCIEPFRTNNLDLIDRIAEKDDQVDLLDREIKLFLVKLSLKDLSEEQGREELNLITMSSNLENVGDVISSIILEQAEKKIVNRFEFSRQGMKEIREFHEQVLETFQLAMSTFASGDVNLARKLLRQKEQIRHLEEKFRSNHIQRLHEGLKETIDTSAIHLDLLANLRRVNSYMCNMAYPILYGFPEEAGEK